MSAPLAPPTSGDLAAAVPSGVLAGGHDRDATDDRHIAVDRTARRLDSARWGRERAGGVVRRAPHPCDRRTSRASTVWNRHLGGVRVGRVRRGSPAVLGARVRIGREPARAQRVRCGRQVADDARNLGQLPGVRASVRRAGVGAGRSSSRGVRGRRGPLALGVLNVARTADGGGIPAGALASAVRGTVGHTDDGASLHRAPVVATGRDNLGAAARMHTVSPTVPRSSSGLSSSSPVP